MRMATKAQRMSHWEQHNFILEKRKGKKKDIFYHRIRLPNKVMERLLDKASDDEVFTFAEYLLENDRGETCKVVVIANTEQDDILEKL